MDETSGEVPSWRVALELLYRGASRLFYWTVMMVAFLAVCAVALFAGSKLAELSYLVSGTMASLAASLAEVYRSSPLMRTGLTVAWYSLNILLWVVFIGAPVTKWLHRKWREAERDLAGDP